MHWKEVPEFSTIEPAKKTRAKQLERVDKFFGKIFPEEEPSLRVTYAIFPSTEELQLFAECCGHNSSIRPLASTVTEDREDLYLVGKISEVIARLDLPDQAKELFAWEVLAKILPYRTCEVGQTFSLYLNRKLQSYRIDHLFLLGEAIPAYGCLPEEGDGSPLLVFRGSEFAMNHRGRVTMKANLDLRAPGHSLFLNKKGEIERWLSEQNRKAMVTGFSLGANLAFFAALYLPEYFDLAVCFNMPGLSKRLLKKWERIDRKAALLTYINRGDLVSKIANLPANHFEISFPTPLAPIRAHNTLLMEHEEIFLSQ